MKEIKSNNQTWICPRPPGSAAPLRLHLDVLPRVAAGTVDLDRAGRTCRRVQVAPAALAAKLDAGHAPSCALSLVRCPVWDTERCELALHLALASAGGLRDL